MPLHDYGHEWAEFLYHTPSEWETGGQAWAVRGGQSTTKPGYHVGPKRMDCYSIHIIREGTLHFISGNQAFAVNKGDIFCMFPGRTYTYYRESACAELQLSWLAFDGPGCLPLLQETGLEPETPCLSKAWSPALQDAADSLFELMRQYAAGSMQQSLEMQGALMRFFSALVNRSRSSQPRSLHWVEQSLQHIELHAAEGITVEQLAAMAGLNRNYFSTAFTQQTGMTPLQCITNVRIAKAKKLLAETSATVTEIAYSLGYSNVFAFTRAFTRFCSLNPTQYREQFRGR